MKKEGIFNLPNRLTIMRMIFVPVIMALIIYTDLNNTVMRIFAAVLFITASVTDFLDGFIARRRSIVTNFGKFLDPLADKCLIICSLMAVGYSYEGIRQFAVWAAAVIFLREMGVTMLRLAAVGSDSNVVPANFAGKVKMLLQCVCMVTIMLEPIVLTNRFGLPPYLFSSILLSLTLVSTVYSGAAYMKSLWHYINPNE